MSFDEDKFYDTVDEIYGVFKQIKRKNASKNIDIIYERGQHLIDAYNEIIDIGKVVYKGNDSELTQDIRSQTIDIRDEVIHCLGILQSHIKVPTNLTEKISVDFSQGDNSDDGSDLHTHTHKKDSDAKDKHNILPHTGTNSKFKNIDDNTKATTSGHLDSKDDKKHTVTPTPTNTTTTNTTTTTTNTTTTTKPPPPPPPLPPHPIYISPANTNTNSQTMDDLDYLGKISRLIKSEYAGEPDGLAAFIEQIEIIELGTPPDKMNLLLKFIKSRLVDKAKDALSDADDTVAKVKTALKNKIKYENAEVVLGRLLALNADRTSLQNFQEKAEELADKLQKAYISTGIPSDVANKMVIAKTVQMCKSSAETDYVKTVIAAAAPTFKEPKETLAMFVTEVTNERKEKKTATVLKFTSNRGRGGHGKGRGRGRQNYGNYDNNGNRRHNNNGQNGNNGNNGGNGQNRRGGSRGRGRSGQQNGNERYVRYIEPGNEQNPAAEGNVLTLQQANR